MPPPEIEYAPAFNTAFKQINTNIDVAVAKFDEVVDSARRWSWMLGVGGSWWIARNLDDVRNGLQAVIDKVEYALDHQYPVLSLISVSFAWVHDVKTPVSELSFRTTEPANENLYEWTGAAATAYNAKAGKQKNAVDETVAKAEFISGWLFGIAKENVAYAVELSKIVTDLAGKLTQAALDTATVIDIPWAIDILANSVGSLVTAGLNNLLTIGERLVDAVGDVRDLATQVGDHSKLPGGLWPEAVRG
jgi:hypothetical protein